MDKKTKILVLTEIGALILLITLLIIKLNKSSNQPIEAKGPIPVEKAIDQITETNQSDIDIDTMLINGRYKVKSDNNKIITIEGNDYLIETKTNREKGTIEVKIDENDNLFLVVQLGESYKTSYYYYEFTKKGLYLQDAVTEEVIELIRLEEEDYEE